MVFLLVKTREIVIVYRMILLYWLQFSSYFQVSKLVPGISASQCRAALEAANWDTSVAVKNLKVDKLYRIGVAEKVVCEKVLKSVDWDLERAAALLLEWKKKFVYTIFFWRLLSGHFDSNVVFNMIINVSLTYSFTKIMLHFISWNYLLKEICTYTKVLTFWKNSWNRYT